MKVLFKKDVADVARAGRLVAGRETCGSPPGNERYLGLRLF